MYETQTVKTEQPTPPTQPERAVIASRYWKKLGLLFLGTLGVVSGVTYYDEVDANARAALRAISGNNVRQETEVQDSELALVQMLVEDIEQKVKNGEQVNWHNLQERLTRMSPAQFEAVLLELVGLEAGDAKGDMNANLVYQQEINNEIALLFNAALENHDQSEWQGYLNSRYEHFNVNFSYSHPNGLLSVTWQNGHETRRFSPNVIASTPFNTADVEFLVNGPIEQVLERGGWNAAYTQLFWSKAVEGSQQEQVLQQDLHLGRYDVYPPLSNGNAAKEFIIPAGSRIIFYKLETHMPLSGDKDDVQTAYVMRIDPWAAQPSSTTEVAVVYLWHSQQFGWWPQIDMVDGTQVTLSSPVSSGGSADDPQNLVEWYFAQYPERNDSKLVR